MTKGTKIWLWAALVLCILTTILNAASGRIPSVILAVCAMIGLALLIFKEKKIGFIILCVSYGLAFIAGVWDGIASGTGILLSIGASLIGSLLIPVVTWLFLRKQFDRLQ